MRRLDLFELHDQGWLPTPIGESVVESLGTTLRWGRILRGLVRPFQQFVARTGATEVLDLCSGSGMPARLLVEELRRAGAPAPRFILTDRSPRREHWEELRRELPGAIEYRAEPVDATRVPSDLGAGRPRLIINAFHHFTPRKAKEILEDAARSSTGIFIAENFERNPLRTFGPGFYGMPAAFANPALTTKDRWSKAALTWLVPIVPAAVAWDGLVSSLRVYNEEELRAMVAHLPDLEWVYGTFTYWPFGRGMYFYGARRAGAAA